MSELYQLLHDLLAAQIIVGNYAVILSRKRQGIHKDHRKLRFLLQSADIALVKRAQNEHSVQALLPKKPRRGKTLFLLPGHHFQETEASLARKPCGKISVNRPVHGQPICIITRCRHHSDGIVQTGFPLFRAVPKIPHFLRSLTDLRPGSIADSLLPGKCLGNRDNAHPCSRSDIA